MQQSIVVVLNEAGDVVGVVFAKVDYDFIMDQFGQGTYKG